MPFWNPKQQEPRHAASEDPVSSPVAPSTPKNEEPLSMAITKREDFSPIGATSDLLLGEGAEFEGKLTFKGTVRIDAKFKGSITTNDVLVVGEHARIDAEITCGTVIVQGEVNGNIKAKTAVELHSPAKVHGNIETPSLIVEKGVLVQGELRMDAERSAKPGATPGIAAVK